MMDELNKEQMIAELKRWADMAKDIAIYYRSDFIELSERRNSVTIANEVILLREVLQDAASRLEALLEVF